jgi:hypothetical protein
MNPADLPSRNCDARFLHQSRWWEDSQWLQEDEEQWLHMEIVASEQDVNKEKKKAVVFRFTSTNLNLVTVYNMFPVMQR